MSDPNNIPPPPPQPENNPYPERPPIFDNPDAPEYQEAEAAASPPPPPPQGALAGGVPTKDERNWGMITHLSTPVISLLLTAAFVPFIGPLAPLVIYLIKKDESEFIADQAKESLNFNLTIVIVSLLATIPFIILMLIPLINIIAAFVAWVLVIIAIIAYLIVVVMATIKASEGVRYRYPFTFRLIK